MIDGSGGTDCYRKRNRIFDASAVANTTIRGDSVMQGE